MEKTPALIARAKEIMRKYQATDETTTTPAPAPQYAAPLIIEALANADFTGNVVSHNGLDFIYVNDTVEAAKEIPRRRTAEDDALLVGPDIPKGTQFTVLWLVKVSAGDWWYVTPWWTRVPMADIKRVSDTGVVESV
jgi:hypothetical protein